MSEHAATCPACGGSGGGPFGRASSAWDVEGYVCPRCAGRGVVGAEVPMASPLARPLAHVRVGKGQAPGTGNAVEARGLAQTRPLAKRTRTAASGQKKQ